MKQALIDISVLLIFFTRHEQFQQVFEQVKKARPSRLFLYQDGPRNGREDDIQNIQKCRKIAENIDWQCEVHRLYQVENVGVDPSGYIADMWAFSQTDKCIVLEDDVVPTISFFSFCKDMLDKYEDDERVMLISGFNVEERTKGLSSDYFFSATTFTWGWASWRRVVDQWDPEYKFIFDEKKKNAVQLYTKKKKLYKNSMNVFQKHLDSRKEHFETILVSNQYLRQGLTIVPTLNMVNNIGIAADSSHYASDLSFIAKGLRKMFIMKRYELDISKIKHPNTVEDYIPYKINAYRIYAWGHPVIKMFRLAETTFYQLRAGKLTEAFCDIKRKIDKVVNRTSS